VIPILSILIHHQTRTGRGGGRLTKGAQAGERQTGEEEGSGNEFLERKAGMTPKSEATLNFSRSSRCFS